MSRHLDIHILHTVPFANLNRDDIGRPKEATYGGVTRARVSSQSWKRAIRLATDPRLIRSRNIERSVAQSLSQDHGWDLAAAALAAQDTLQGLTSAADAGKEVTVFLHGTQIDDLTMFSAALDQAGYTAVAASRAHATRTQLEAVSAASTDRDRKAAERRAADAARREFPTPGLTKEAKKRRDDIISRADGAMALFGRMFANRPDLNLDACMQVAHALSTHAVEVEPDYFTAVEDLPELSTDQGSGAAHMQTSEYMSATFYRYLTVSIDELSAQVGAPEAKELLVNALAAAASALPSGKQSTTAAFTPPDLVALALREDRPINYVGAFEAPVRAASGGGHVQPSITQLAKQADDIATYLGAPPVWAAYTTLGRSALGHAREHAGAATGGPAARDPLGVRIDAMPELIGQAVAQAYPDVR